MSVIKRYDMPSKKPIQGSTPPVKTGRPKKELNWKQIDSALQCLCTDDEIASIMGVNPTIIARDCKKRFGISFADYGREKREGGKMSLRRKMYTRAVADGSDTMLIWLSKNQLGWADKVDTTVSQTTDVRVSFDDFREGLPQ